MNTTILAQGDSWDLESFFENASEYAKVAGGALLVLVGVIMIIWGGVLLGKKLMSEQARENWLKIALLIIAGGALAFGGITIIMKFAKGGNETVEKFGNGGSILVSEVSNHVGNLVTMLPF